MTYNKLGRYDLIRVLGRGAMGLVYEGRDPNLDRRVAIKTIKVENLSDEAAAEYEARFRTEARSAARLQHPNIVSVYDSDRDGDIAFLVMEYIEGEDLKHHLDLGKRHTFEQTLAVMRDLLSALEYAHRAKIIHRDIKPANLLIEASGRVKLTDFGVARIQDSGDATRTQGSMVGTLKYMSPEQVQGMPVDARTDLFAAGVVLYQLLTGQRAFDGDSDFAVIQRIVTQDAVAPTLVNPKLPPAIDAVVARALAKSRDQRYATAQEFAAALEGCAREGFDPSAVAPSTSPALGNGRSSTWTGTVRAGESLVDTRSGLGTGTWAGTSAVAQELELVYWKDVKDSTDIEDVQGFLMKFPQGIYADLARRRLRRLARGDGATGGTGTGTGTGASVFVTPGAAAIEKTQIMLRSGKAGQLGAMPMPAPASAPAEPATKPGVDSAWEALAESGESVSQQAAAPADVARHVSTFTSASGGATDTQLASPVETAARSAKPDGMAQATDARHGYAVGNEHAENAESAGTSTKDAEIAAAPRTQSPQRMPWVLAGVAVLSGLVFFGVHRMSRPVVDEVAAPASTASAPAVLATPALAATTRSDPTSVATTSAATGAPAASAPALAAVNANAVSTPAVAARAQAARAAASSASTVAASVAATAPTAALAAARNAAAENDKAARTPMAGVAGASATSITSTSPGAARPTRPGSAGGTGSTVGNTTAGTTSIDHAATGGGGPRQACEDRNFIAFQNCMTEQCARPLFSTHAVCVERRGMEQRRRDTEQQIR